jgi:hypothetical protein
MSYLATASDNDDTQNSGDLDFESYLNFSNDKVANADRIQSQLETSAWNGIPSEDDALNSLGVGVSRMDFGSPPSVSMAMVDPRVMYEMAFCSSPFSQAAGRPTMVSQPE